MCLIIRKPRGRRVPADFLRQAWQHNRDGWGTVLTQPGERPVAHKGMCLGSLIEHNEALPVGAEVHLHLRKATLGAVTAAMAHPHVVRDDALARVLLMHNGTIARLAPADAALERSDSAELARLLGELLAGLEAPQAAALLRSSGFARLVAPLIEGSMVVLLDAQGAVCLGREWHVVQPDQWHRGMWGIEVSNTRTWLAEGAATALA